MHSPYESNDDDDLIDEDPPPTQRTPGSATLYIEEKTLSLFISATWKMVATVKDSHGSATLIEESLERSHPFLPVDQRAWGRQVVRLNLRQLRRLGVNVDAAYVVLGGDLEDLEESG